MKTNKFLSVLWDYFLMTVGSLIFCMAWTSIIIPTGLASGGLTGLCTIIQYATGGAIPIGWTYPIINIGLLIIRPDYLRFFRGTSIISLLDILLDPVKIQDTGVIVKRKIQTGDVDPGI